MDVQELNSNFHETGKKQLQYISWGKPNQGWVKLNVDGASKHNPKRASAGGLIINEYGQCIVGFSANLEHASNVVAKLWAILMGLRIAWNSGKRKIVIESDSKTAILPMFSEPNRVSTRSSSGVNGFNRVRSGLNRMMS